MDVKTILRIQGCLTFRVPVNRKNLMYVIHRLNVYIQSVAPIVLLKVYESFSFDSYDVRPKNSNSAKTLDEIAQYITAKHRNSSGIVYCLSKRDTEV